MANTGSCATEACGLLAAGAAALAYGSFGVPLKALKGEPHPLVLQSYKTLGLVSLGPILYWLVVLRPSPQPIRFTYWGLVSGALWILGGTSGVYAIRTAGLAVAVGTWATVMVIMNFFWGFGVFGEPVRNIQATAASLVLLVIGLVGMSRATAAAARGDNHDNIAHHDDTENNDEGDDEDTGVRTLIRRDSRSVIHRQLSNQDVELRVRRNEQENHFSTVENDSEAIVMISSFGAQHPLKNNKEAIFTIWFGASLNNRTKGILGAVMNGILSGSSLIPVHLAKKQGLGGAFYWPSFCVGAFLSNAIIIALYTAWNKDGLVWNTKKWAGAGLCAGAIMSCAMLASFVAVTQLGQGVGNSIIQIKILVSGMWGIAYFGEMKGRRCRWVAYALLSVAAIIWLSAERWAATHTTELETRD